MITLAEVVALAMRHNGSISFGEQPGPVDAALAEEIAGHVIAEIGLSGLAITPKQVLPLSRLVAFEIAPAFAAEPKGDRNEFVARVLA